MNLTKHRTRPKITALVGAAAVLGLAASTFAAGTAFADYAPSGSDVVSVSGSTPQYVGDFLANGDTVGDAGYNSAGNVNRYVNFDATADGNGRDAYANGSTLASPIALNPSVVYRAGSAPVQRLQSSGNDLSALLSDTGAQENINFAVVASLPTPAQQTQATSNGWGGLHVVQLGTDPEVIVTANTSNAPAGLSVAELVGIYSGAYVHWNDIPGNVGRFRRRHHPAPPAVHLGHLQDPGGRPEDGQRRHRRHAGSLGADGRAERPGCGHQRRP